VGTSKGGGKVMSEYMSETQKGNACKVHRIMILGNRRIWVVSFTPWTQCSPLGKTDGKRRPTSMKVSPKLCFC
jgi:hypothetical protein